MTTEEGCRLAINGSMSARNVGVYRDLTMPSCCTVYRDKQPTAAVTKPKRYLSPDLHHPPRGLR